jgi:hypothetical protein
VNTEIGKIIKYFINFTKLGNYIYKPTDTRLSSVTLPEFLRDAELKGLLTGIGVTRYSQQIEIAGMATDEHLKSFLSLPEGKLILQRILELSTANGNINVEELFDDIFKELNN